VLTHCQERHRRALGTEDDGGWSLRHQGPHLLNIVINGDLAVFVDLDDPISRSVTVRELIGREVGSLRIACCGSCRAR
jgi:hypothetical protein